MISGPELACHCWGACPLLRWRRALLLCNVLVQRVATCLQLTGLPCGLLSVAVACQPSRTSLTNIQAGTRILRSEGSLVSIPKLTLSHKDAGEAHQCASGQIGKVSDFYEYLTNKLESPKA